MPKLNDLTAEDFVKQYNPARDSRGFVSKEEWREIRPFVRQAISPLMDLKATSLRPFLIALTRLGVFAHKNAQAMKVEIVLSPAMIKAFVATLKKGERDVEPNLWRLAKAWNLVPSSESVTDGVPRPDYLTPYTTDEIDALVDAALNQPTTLRSATLLSIIFLGAGAGVVRIDAREVTSTDIHFHSDGSMFVFAGDHCAKVLPEFVELANQVRALRPTGRLRGDRDPSNLTANAAVWIKGRRGVPALSADRLRATYMCALLESGTGLLDLLSWSGLKSAEALDGYINQVSGSTSDCEFEAKENN